MSQIPAVFGPTDPEEQDEQEGLPHSCFLLEFSIKPGGGRKGDVHVGVTVDDLRKSFSRDYYWEDGDDNGYLVITYGALLHLWVVQQGVIVEGIDVHQFLRTGDERCDQTLARLIARRKQGQGRSGVVNKVLAPHAFYPAPALPLLTRVLELQDRIEANPADTDAELNRILQAAEAGQAPAAFNGVRVERLHIDWNALAQALPPLRGPILATDWVSVRWADPALRPSESYLHVYSDPTEPQVLGIGLNDLENGWLNC